MKVPALLLAAFVLFPIIGHYFFYLGLEPLVADGSETVVLKEDIVCRQQK